MTKLTALTCPQCLAPVRNVDRCEYCGSVFRVEEDECIDGVYVSDNMSNGRDMLLLWNHESRITERGTVNQVPYDDGEEDADDAVVQNSAKGYLTFNTDNGAERARILSGGNFGINVTAPAVSVQSPIDYMKLQIGRALMPAIRKFARL